MARGIHVEVKGLKEIQAKLSTFSATVQKKTMIQALASAAKVLRERVIAFAPSDTGELRRNIRQYVFVKTGAVAVATVKPAKAVAYARFLEFGTSKMRPHPFMRPAFESAKEQALERFREKLAELVAALRA